MFSLPPDATPIQALVYVLGPDITSDADVVRALLSRFNMTENNPPTNLQVAEMVTALARMASEGTVLCDVGALVRALNSLVSQSRCYIFTQLTLGLE